MEVLFEFRKVLCPTLLTKTCPPQGLPHLHCSSVPGKKDGEMDRNFDTLDLPKRTEAAKGEWVEAESRLRPMKKVEFRLRPVQVVKLCATKQA